jgi:hypothetical protein
MRYVETALIHGTGLVFQVRKADQPEGYFVHDIMMEGRPDYLDFCTLSVHL